MWTKYLGFGALFGFILSRVGATQYDAINGMFLLTDLHLMGVIAVAVVVAAVGLRWPWLFRRPAGAPALGIQAKPIKHGTIAGGALFGAGWALTGTCPGTGLAQIGEGQMTALFTVAGIFLGTWLYRRLGLHAEHAIASAKQSISGKSLVRDADSLRARAEVDGAGGKAMVSSQS